MIKKVVLSPSTAWNPENVKKLEVMTGLKAAVCKKHVVLEPRK